jgi:SpoVK/Ycf46/Vps4 family AAA+-type ATPase
MNINFNRNEDQNVINLLIEEATMKKVHDHLAEQKDNMVFSSVLDIQLKRSATPLKVCSHVSKKYNISMPQPNYIAFHLETGYAALRANEMTTYLFCYGPTPEYVEQVEKDLRKVLNRFIWKKSSKKRTPTLIVNWYTVLDELVQNNIVTKLDDVVLPEAYPYIDDMENYIERYLQSDENLLLLSGPAGTGKTKLIREICRHVALQNQSNDAIALYTSDERVLFSDLLFMDYINMPCDLMILEDLDSLLKPREEGNIFMSKLLNTSDGLVKVNEKKIILSTNITKIAELDSALIRKGRCFDILKTRKLNNKEGETLLSKLEFDTSLEEKDYSLAELYALSKGEELKNQSDSSFGF